MELLAQPVVIAQVGERRAAQQEAVGCQPGDGGLAPDAPPRGQHVAEPDPARWWQARTEYPVEKILGPRAGDFVPGEATVIHDANAVTHGFALALHGRAPGFVAAKAQFPGIVTAVAVEPECALPAAHLAEHGAFLGQPVVQRRSLQRSS